jgi:hypothetical protein
MALIEFFFTSRAARLGISGLPCEQWSSGPASRGKATMQPGCCHERPLNQHVGRTFGGQEGDAAQNWTMIGARRAMMDNYMHTCGCSPSSSTPLKRYFSYDVFRRLFKLRKRCSAAFLVDRWLPARRWILNRDNGGAAKSISHCALCQTQLDTCYLLRTYY